MNKINHFSPETRPFQARIINYPLNSDFIQLKRRFQCTFFCYNRPRLDVILNENGQKNYLGFIVLPCKLSCDYRLEIWQNRKRKFIIIGSCCQLGIILKSLPCEDCQSAEFSLIDAQNGGELSKIRKVVNFPYLLKIYIVRNQLDFGNQL